MNHFMDWTDEEYHLSAGYKADDSEQGHHGRPIVEAGTVYLPTDGLPPAGDWRENIKQRNPGAVFSMR